MLPGGGGGGAEAVSLNGPKSAGMVASLLPTGDDGVGALKEDMGVPQRGQMLIPGWSAVPHVRHCMEVTSFSVKIVSSFAGAGRLRVSRPGHS
jgi:hypothetical protein